MLTRPVTLTPGRPVMFHGPHFIVSTMQAETTPIITVFGMTGPSTNRESNTQILLVSAGSPLSSPFAISRGYWGPIRHQGAPSCSKIAFTLWGGCRELTVRLWWGCRNDVVRLWFQGCFMEVEVRLKLWLSWFEVTVMLQGDCRHSEARLQCGCCTKGCMGLQQGCSNVAKRSWGNSREVVMRLEEGNREVLMRLQGGCRYIVLRLWQSCGEDVARLKGVL